MSIDIETYRLKAQEAIEYVFVKEYHNSLGIPMPIVKMLLPDDANYSTGQYYITIDKTWQIHLNFGKLPISYHEFQNEVKVLTRHEIEHYMCCPFDVITHFRMLKRIRDVYYKHFSHLGINIEYACGAISNQAADIIVDTKNYYRHSKETLKSEIDWIKIGANISACPRHCKLMFLTKEAIWKEDLGINETDPEFLKIVHQLADSFTKNGIEDKSSFLDKVEEYYGNVYSTLYKGSFAQVAQAQRHRTIDYQIEMLDKINKLGIGPGGLGGTTTALKVNINTYPTHIAGLPVAVNICCHVNRHVVREI